MPIPNLFLSTCQEILEYANFLFQKSVLKIYSHLGIDNAPIWAAACPFMRYICHDNSLRTTSERGIDKTIYIIPIYRISDHWLMRYFNKKASRLNYYLDRKKLPPPCSLKENWNGRKCLDYCPVKENCPQARELQNLTQAIR